MTQQISHINCAIPAKKHPQMYLMQKYWARKPHNVVAEYIERYSNPNGIVLDPFLGSGVTLLEALRLKRKAIGFDIDPFSVLITRTTLDGTDIPELEDKFDSIQNDVQAEIDQLYPAICPNCKERGIIRYVVWSYVVLCPACNKRILMAEARRPRGKRQNIYKCPFCGQDFSYANIDIADEEPVVLKMHCVKCNSNLNVKTPKLIHPSFDLASTWYPKIKFTYNGDRPFVTKRRATTIEELYTQRNLYALGLLWNRILQIREEKIRKTFQFIFVSMVPQASRLIPWRRGFKTGGPAWTVPEYLILPVHCEFNVWSRFENRFRAIKRGLEDRCRLLPQNVSAANDFESLTKSDYYLSRVNALAIGSVIPPNSIDYVFTDPPYGGAIQYFELDLIRAAWLIGKENGEAIEQWWKEEITVNARGQQKSFEYYHKMLAASFAEIYKVLRPEHYLTVTFHSTDIDVWNSIIIAVRLAGFELEKILYNPPAVKSAKSSLQPYGSAVGDYYIRYRKPAQKKEYTPEQVDKQKYRRVVIDTTKRIIARRREATPFTFILNGIIPELDRQGVFFVDKRGYKGIEEVLRESLGIDFVLKPIIDAEGEEIGQGWWLKDPSSIPYLEDLPLSERVERLVINILNDKVIVSYDDVLQQVFTTFPNAMTPNTQSVREVLEEYATQTRDGKWMLKPKFKERISEHDTYVKSLADLGARIGFQVHADIEGYRKGSFPFHVVNSDRIKEIDVVWYTESEAIAEFEVENTTVITEAVVRGANIDSSSILRVVVVPEEHKRLLKRKVREPVLNELIAKYGWKMITYAGLTDFLAAYKRKTPTLDALRSLLVSLINFKIEVQESIQKFIGSRS